MSTPDAPPADTPGDILAIERPVPGLLVYYVLSALLTVVAFPVVMPVLYFRYHTMRYRFTDEGVSMRWGILFRREINLTYARIQDIHLTSNLVERWLGLARIQIQTASGSAKAEMTIEGVPQFEALRDFLYARMRGAKGGAAAHPGGADGPERSTPAASFAAGALGEVADLLRETASELRQLREVLARRGGGSIDG
jgi:putative membrane protein